MMETSQGRAALCWGVFLCAVWIGGWGARETCAQSDGPAAADASAEAPPLPLFAPFGAQTPDTQSHAGPKIDLAHPDLIYLESPMQPGTYIPVRPNASFEEFQEFLRTRAAGKPPGAVRPGYFVTSLALDGRVEGETAVLKARVEVQVDRDNGDFLVPLKLNEATLLDTSYSGPGSATPDTRDREAGYRWWFRGKGTHQLNLSLSVDLRNQVPGQRLQLSLPTTAVSFLKLRVPQPNVSVRAAPGGSRPEVRGLGAGESEITLYGLGPRLDVTWQPVFEPEAVETQLQSTTFMAVGFTPDEVVLDVTQVVQAVQGRFDSLTIRLPDHFSVQKLERGDFVMQPREGNKVVIQFHEATAGPVELKWILAAGYSDLPDGDQRVGIYGFDIVREREGPTSPYQVRQQSGYIAIDAGEDYVVTTRENASSDVLRRSVSSLGKNREFRAAVQEGRISGAYQFLKQPFFLSLDLSPVVPYFTADPRFVLLLSDGRAELQGTLDLQVNRGTVSEIELPWPEFTTENWTLEPVNSPGQVQADANGLRIEHLPPPKTDGWVECRFKASRPLPPTAEGVHTITLPRVGAASGAAPTLSSPPLLVIADAENVKSSVTATAETRMKAVPVLAETVPVELRSLSRVSAFRLDSPEARLNTRVEVKPQELVVDSTVEVAVSSSNANDRAIRVTQTLGYNVEFERLAQARLLVPQQLRSMVRFLDEDGSMLVPSFASQPGDETVAARIGFDEPRIGRFVLQAQYEVPYPESESGTTTFSIPLVQSQDESFREVELRWLTQPDVAVSPVDASWTGESSMTDMQVWRSVQPSFPITLKLEPSDRTSPRTFRVPRAYLRSEVAADGRIRTVAHYRLTGQVGVLGLALPSSTISRGSFWWDGRELDGAQALPTGPSVREYRLDLTAFEANQGGLLTVEYLSESQKPLGWSDLHTVDAPAFIGDLRVGQTAWEICLPTSQYLFTSPRRVTPEFDWARSFVFWSRVPSGPLANPRGWIGADEGLEEVVAGERTNNYPFRGYGDVPSITFRSISLPMMVLLGAGTALLVGFVLLMLPATRSMLTVLAVAFLVALVALWYAEPVQLLMQWALLGLLLATAAAYIDATVKSPRAGTVVTMSSPSDFLPPSSSIDRPAGVGIGSDDPTQHRGRAEQAVETISSAELGRRS